jgi:hypothetical protein
MKQQHHRTPSSPLPKKQQARSSPSDAVTFRYNRHRRATIWPTTTQSSTSSAASSAESSPSDAVTIRRRHHPTQSPSSRHHLADDDAIVDIVSRIKR